MKIIDVETIVPDVELSRPFIFVLVHTDEGVTGLGQTADVRTAPIVHDLAERFLIGADPQRITALWHEIFEWVAYHGYAGAEARALSAIDIALWDIKGQATGRPIVDLLGGVVHDSVPTYNTCGSYRGVSDRQRMLDDPVELARDLLANGFTCLKWSPFDKFARESAGQRISGDQLGQVVRTLERIASEFGEMEFMIEAHGLWAAAPAARIVEALGGLPVRWIEDPLAQDNVAEWARLREKSPIPVAGGERLQTRHQLHKLLVAGGVDVVISDITWTGGITEARRIADLADLYGVSFASHGNSGPVNVWAAAHVLTGTRNAYAAEIVRVHLQPDSGYFDSVVEGPRIFANARLSSPSAPGLGIRLRDDLPVQQRRSTRL
jgi:L-alanine-DL-glutamate epimerase-like enolase superfamily enzyme